MIPEPESLSAPCKKPDGACQVKQALEASNRMRRCTMKSVFAKKNPALKKICQIAMRCKKITIFSRSMANEQTNNPFVDAKISR